MKPAIHLRNVHKSFDYRNHAVSQLDLEVPHGTFMGFFGPNGAGKTTTIKVMLNLLQPSGGRAEVLGTDSRKLGPNDFQRIGYVSENQELPNWMTLRQLLEYCRPLYPNWDDAFCDKLLKQFQLPLGKTLRSMSRGMQMKASLLSSLSYRPDLVILDEPFSGLDPLSRDQFVEGLLELSEEHPFTLFLSTHDVDEVERLCDTVAFIRNGRMNLCESTESLLNRFRRVEASAPQGDTTSTKHNRNLLIEHQGSRLSGIDRGFTTSAESERRLQEMYPGATGVLYTPMRLREIIVHLSEGYQRS